MFVQHRFELDPETISEIRGMTPEFGYNGFGEFIFYRTYSRLICKSCRHLVKYDCNTPICPAVNNIACACFELGQETWNDTVIRCVEGTFSIRKDWYIKNHINWDTDFWQHYARHLAISMFKMHWLPPGRGLWAMGTNFVYERGSMALNNCAWCIIGDDMGADCSWVMDALMMGTGVGFQSIRNDDLKVYRKVNTYNHIINDDREGWCLSVESLIDSYTHKEIDKPEFDYSKIRKKDLPIRGFGGISSGPEVLKILHNQIDQFFEMYLLHPWYTSVFLKTDIVNCIGFCVVSGNVRRSAELLAGKYEDIIDLKNYEKYPYRESFGGLSNNSVLLEEDKDFNQIPNIAESIKTRGEPGLINIQNLKLARIGKRNKGLKVDRATGQNPCGEINLENHELCCLAITCPTRCDNHEEWLRACEYASFYASTVTLLPTHSHETNEVILRNRRIGIDITDVVGWKEQIGTTKLIKYLRRGYKKIRATNKWLNTEAGVPEAIRVTTIKPGGTVPKNGRY